MRHLGLVVVLVGFSLWPASSSIAAGVNAQGCYNPVDFGATPNNPADDDRPAIQAAMDAATSAGGGRVCLPGGRFRITRAPPGAYNRFAALSTHGAHLELMGSGPGTVIEMVGDQGAATTFVISIDPGASDITIRDLTIDTSQMTNTDEQTHAIEVGSPVGTGLVQDFRIDHVRIVHPGSSVPGVRKGDCLRFVGNTPDSLVRRATVVGSTFTSCARSGIAIQRNVHDLVIIGNQFTQASDQDIDSEPTGAGTNGSVAIIGNIFRDDVAIAQGDFAVTVGGISGPMARITLADNVFEGRGVNCYRVSDAAFTGNAFDATMESGYGVIEVENVADRLVINGNTIHRQGFAGPPIRITHHSGGFASNAVVSNNVLTNDTAGGGIVMESVADATVSNNDLYWTVPATTAQAIYLRSTIRPADGVMISNNRIVGSLGAAIFLGASPQPFEAVSIVGNMSRGPAVSLRCDQSVAGLFHQPIVHAANRWETPPSCAAATLVTSFP